MEQKDKEHILFILVIHAKQLLRDGFPELASDTLETLENFICECCDDYGK